MSRRPPNPSADRAAQNQQTLKTLVKVEGNKSCADCKRNKHPRWASWNLGIFVCIRCSGIHRGMGTHISRVKSVDLDAWTDEQLQSMLRWGNTRANKYWEAKLAPGHIPAENKIENFIRTKYDTKRWVMEGPMPDPASLDAGGDDDIKPLNLVQEKAKLDRSSSITRAASAPVPVAAPAPAPMLDLFGDTPLATAPQANAGRLSGSAKAPKMSSPPPAQQQDFVNAKGTKPGESLLGFDFFGASPSASASRPASAATSATTANPSRPDLKQSILSLYASAARSPPPPQQHSRFQPTSRAGFCDAPSETDKAPGGLEDAFGSLAFGNAPSSSSLVSPRNPTASSMSASSTFSTTATPSTNGGSRNSSTMGGTFFDSKPKVGTTTSNTAPRPSLIKRASSSSRGFGEFATGRGPSAPAATSLSSSRNDLDDMLDFSVPVSTTAAGDGGAPSIDQTFARSPFNLSKPSASPQVVATPATLTNKTLPGGIPGTFSSKDPWGSNEAWASSHTPAPLQSAARPDPVPPLPESEWSTPADVRQSEQPAMATIPQVTADEDFGGWESSAAASSVSAKANLATTKPGANFGGGEDLFSNVWE